MIYNSRLEQPSSLFTFKVLKLALNRFFLSSIDRNLLTAIGLADTLVALNRNIIRIVYVRFEWTLY